MVELHPPHNSWHIGLMFGLLIIMAINAFDYFETELKGKLKDESGILSIQRVKNKNTVIFIGNERNGVCIFHKCLKRELISTPKIKAIVKLDDSNKIFEISVDGNILFGKEDSDLERSGYVFKFLICLVLFIGYLFFFVLKRKNNVR